ncbi:MAG TPA: hypothetical protein VHA75_15975 [Rugosimonospora sp.]|nr:hypothetical protein [Rugosimonospora sp.]
MTASYAFVAYSVGVCSASACTSLTDEEAVARINEQYPTGISTAWEIAPDKTFATGQPNPTPCEHHPETHRHILFNC